MFAEKICEDPLKLNLLGYPYDPEVGITNTIDEWTSLDMRAPLLHAVFRDRFKVRKELYKSGYGLTEISGTEFPTVSIEAIRKTVSEVERPPLVIALRQAFPYRTTKWRTDELISVLRCLMMGLRYSEIARVYGVNVRRLSGKREKLLKSGFPIPDPKSDKPSWNELQKGNEWSTLSDALRDVMGKRLRTFDLIIPHLKEIRIECRQRKINGVTRHCYFIPVADVQRLGELYSRKPEIFISRTWSVRPARDASMEYVSFHGLENCSG